MNNTLGEAPPRPPISADVPARIERAEQRRGRAVKSLLLVGSLTFAAGLIPSAVGLFLLFAGLLTVFPLAALAAFLVGPTWQQRQDHWRLLRLGKPDIGPG
jgi:hypothetical protein